MSLKMSQILPLFSLIKILPNFPTYFTNSLFKSFQNCFKNFPNFPRKFPCSAARMPSNFPTKLFPKPLFNIFTYLLCKITISSLQNLSKAPLQFFPQFSQTTPEIIIIQPNMKAGASFRLSPFKCPKNPHIILVCPCFQF